MNKKTMTVADFFCGAGGFTEGFRQKGFDVIFSLDNWAPAKKTHDLNHPNCHCELMDILELDTVDKIEKTVPDTDIIVGSPPCVSFSGSNKAGKADKSLGIQLIKAYLRIVALKLKKGTCKYWILENVPNSGKYIQDSYTWDDLELPGGKKIAIEIPVKEVLNAAEYGAPQTRRRFVCGNYPSPKKTDKEWITMRKVQDALSNPLEAKHSTKIKDPIYGFELDANNLTDHFYDTTVADYEWKRSKRLKEDHGFMGKMSFPEYLDRPSRTVMATMSASTRESIIFDATKSNKQIGYRLPTIREIASFMSFPITYQFEGSNENTKYKLIGNAVCCKLSASLAEAIAKAEGIKNPEYVPQKIIKASVDLTGIKRTPKTAKPRIKNAKFAIPIPYLKIKSFRVELSNTDSNFSKEQYVWKSKVHYGSGKSAKIAELNLKDLEKVLRANKNFSSFKIDLEKAFKDFKLSARELQESYVMNGHSKTMSPDKALEIIRSLITKYYSNQENVFVENTFSEIERNDLSILTLVGAYACGYFVSLIRN